MMKYAKVMNIVGANEEEDNNNYRGQLQQLPDEIIFYILSFLPLSSLLTFRCVCKLWNTLFLHPRLSFLHFLSSKFRGLDLDDVGSRDKEFDRSRGRHFSKIATTSEGLLELEAGRSVRVDGSRYRIRCPILRQHLHIPNPPPPQNPSTRTSLCIALEFVPSTQAVKLVSVHEDDQNQYSLGYNILALGVGTYRTSYCWRAIKVPPRNLPHRERAALRRMKLRLFFRMGVAYCISYVRTYGYDLDIEVDVLDMVNESYIGHTTFPRSGGFFSKMSSTTILDWNGLLSIAQLVKDELHVLVLHDYKRLKWDERKRIIKLPFLKPDHKELLTFSSCADNSKLYFVRQDDNPESLSHNTTRPPVTTPLSQTSWDRLYESLLKSDHNELLTFSTFSDNSKLFCVRQDELESAMTISIARTSWEWLYELSLKPDLKEYFCTYDFNTGKLITVGSQKASRTDTVLQRNQLEINRFTLL